jgi:hypothetical protein
MKMNHLFNQLMAQQQQAASYTMAQLARLGFTQPEKEMTLEEMWDRDMLDALKRQLDIQIADGCDQLYLAPLALQWFKIQQPAAEYVSNRFIIYKERIVKERAV